MSAYNELIKNFERVRAYMRDFYVYGFKSREEYRAKSARSYDDERRRIESWLGDYMSFVRTPDGKNMFISIDSRQSVHNPLYKAWKSKSFTDGDITLHFLIFDILSEDGITLSDIMHLLDARLSAFENPFAFDESTVRKKLKEYMDLGLVISEKQGRRSVYRRADDVDISKLSDVLNFFSEASPCGEIGSFLLDRNEGSKSPFGFKHHYITGTLDDGVLCSIFTALRKKSYITLKNLSRRSNLPQTVELVPLRVFISVQNGRQHLLAFQPRYGKIKAFRIDYLSDPKIGSPYPNFDSLRALLDEKQKYMWGVAVKNGDHSEKTETVEFTVYVPKGEEYVARRLYREKRCGTVEKLDDFHYRFHAEVYDSGELKPWIRTFLCRIVQLDFSNRTVENEFKRDIEDMYRLYGLKGGDDE